MKSRLLAADPDRILLQIYRAYFPTLGFEVATAGDGLECLERLREFVPDVLILSLDLNWGGAEGVLAVIREEAKVRPIPVVLTGEGKSRSNVAQLVAPPVVKLLEKPFQLRDLEAVLEATLRARVFGLVTGTLDPRAARASDQASAADEDCRLTTRHHRDKSGLMSD